MVKDIKVIKRLLPLLKLYPWAIPSMISLGMLSSLFEGFGISLLIPFLQSFNSTPNSEEINNSLIRFLNYLFNSWSAQERLIIIPFFILASILVKNLIYYGNHWLLSWLNSRISHRLRCEIFNQLLQVNYSYLENQNTGRLLNTLATETWRTNQALAILVNLIVNVCTAIVYLILLLLISWQLTLLVALIMLIISLLIQGVTRKSKSLGYQAVQSNSELGLRMYEGLTGMRTIRSFGQENYEQKRFYKSSRQVQNNFFKMDLLSGLVNPLYEVFSALLVVTILVIALLQDRTALPTLLTFLFMLYRLQPQMQQLDWNRVTLLTLSSAVEDVMSFIEQEDKPYIRSGSIPFEGLQLAISFESVNFSYNPGEKPALQDITLCIPRGKTTALVGPSGAGKSTLIGLICRFYEIDSGEIYIDGRPIKQLNLTDWRSRIAIVSQDIHIFSTTIRDNIAYGRLEATDAEIIGAAKQANAHEFISQLPQGYDTQVGDRGIRLSGGQRQRIALARAIIRNPDILILDEATNALDTISEHLIQEALNTLSRDRTVIVIAHRLSTIEQADQIIVLDKGRVIEKGDLKQLLQLDGLFAKLYRLQYEKTQL